MVCAQQPHTKPVCAIVCTHTPSAVHNPWRATPTTAHTVCALGDKMLVWQTCNGVLHRVLAKCGHYQDITVIKVCHSSHIGPLQH